MNSHWSYEIARAVGYVCVAVILVAILNSCNVEYIRCMNQETDDSIKQIELCTELVK